MAFFLYRFLLSPLAWLFLQVGSWFGDRKWKSLIRAKNSGAFHRNRGDEASLRAARPFWIHAASGEIEYARPVIRELKARFPTVPVVVTYGSPSAVRILEKIIEIDAWGPVPWEFAGSVRAFLRRFEPRALLIARTDVWPVLLDVVSAEGIPSLLFAATFARGSSRLRGFARRLTARSLRQLSAIQVVAEEDRANLAGMGVDAKIAVVGDTRFDQVFHRLANPQELPASLRPARGPVFIAGSTWPEDEAKLLPAFAARSDWKLLLAPHEIGEARLSALETELARLGMGSQRFTAGGSWTKRVLLLDRVGVLAELYAWGDLAFVGGSFRRQVHSVMEPLASGLRVLVGPFHENNREALAFRRELVGPRPAVLEVRSSEDVSAALADASLLGDRDAVKAAVAARRGASARVIEWCAGFADDRR